MDDDWRSYPEWCPPDWTGQAKTCQGWLETRRKDLEEKSLWRIHDGLYDVTDFIKHHPGGAYWLTVTQGTDITEAFESHHLSDKARNILPKYFIRKATTKRNSPFTFEKDGFYETLRNRVKEKIKDQKGPSVQSKMMIDSLFTGTIIFSVLAGIYQNYIFAFVASLFLTFTTVCAHNFFHQRDNWRMYFFQLSLLSVRDWRISHAMSHHLFPNTLHDLEITMFEPWFQYLPRPDKSFTARFFSLLYWPIVYLLILFAESISRLMVDPDGLKELIPLVIPLSMILCNVPVITAVIWWVLIIFMASFMFSLVGLNAAHHHPEIFHDGDEPRKNRDWGVYQLDAVRDRTEIKGILPLVLILFGDHTLHHLFPTLDHAHLAKLYPVLEETCKEFNVDFKLHTIVDLLLGQFKQLTRNTKRKLS
uniref:Cytochrome b5 heme-binding domain-containing protein n=1 Tax=Riptortus pedestris TaxID=329032 RepID=R4WNE6_RIPPE|nr:conserved hypothetical protein [Riptortus pedestris]